MNKYDYKIISKNKIKNNSKSIENVNSYDCNIIYKNKIKTILNQLKT